MYNNHYSIMLIIIGIIEVMIMFALYSTFLLNISYTITLIIPTMALSFILLIKDCNQSSFKAKQRFSYVNSFRNYHRVFQLLLQSNDIMIYGIIGCVLIYNIPIHAYMVTYMTTFNISKTQKVLFLLILAIQTSGFIFLLSIPATVNKKVSVIRDRFEKTLLVIPDQDVRLKWKYLTCLEFLDTKPQVGYTLFPYGAITFNLIIQVCTLIN